LPHRASFKAGDEFPLCAKCADGVRFELLVAADIDNGKGK
jgi:hypothetical protein